MRDHKKLKAFSLADELALMTYETTREFPKEEVYALTSQMRRAAVSVPSNIVEGCARESQADYVHFLSMAFGSLRELHYQYTLAKRLGYVDDVSTLLNTKLEEAERVLGGLIRSLRSARRK